MGQKIVGGWAGRPGPKSAWVPGTKVPGVGIKKPVSDAVGGNSETVLICTMNPIECPDPVLLFRNRNLKLFFSFDIRLNA